MVMVPEVTPVFASAKWLSSVFLKSFMSGAALIVLAQISPVFAESATSPQNRPVLVTSVHYATEGDSRTFVASIRPRVEGDQGFRVAGKVARRLVDVGRQVSAGDSLATLDETDLRLQKEQAAAELSSSAMILQQTTSDEQRGLALKGKGWTSQAVYDRQRSAVEEARGRNKRAQHAFELATNALAYATLRADADGVVTAVNVEPGQVVAAGQPAIRIARKGEKEALVALPETYVARARDAKASLTLWALPGRKFKAVLRELSPIADPATRSFAARFSLPDADDSISLGMSATLTLTDASPRPVARVPLSALYDQGKGPSLWSVQNDGALILKSVTVMLYDGRDALISGGVAEGERVVILGVQKLDAGQKVRTISQIAF